MVKNKINEQSRKSPEQRYHELVRSGKLLLGKATLMAKLHRLRG